MIIAFNFQHHQILLYDQWKRPHCSPFQKNELKCASSKDLMRKKKKIQHKSRNFLPSSFNILRSSNYYTTPRDYRLHPSKTNWVCSNNMQKMKHWKNKIEIEQHNQIEQSWELSHLRFSTNWIEKVQHSWTRKKRGLLRKNHCSHREGTIAIDDDDGCIELNEYLWYEWRKIK